MENRTSVTTPTRKDLQENPKHYAGYKEDRDYSNNSSKLHPEPNDRGDISGTPKTTQKKKLQAGEPAYAPNNLPSRDCFDTKPPVKQKPDQKEGQAFAEGHDRPNTQKR